MAEKSQIYKCGICGNIVMVMHGGAGTLVCCGQDMALESENTVDAALEKHVPVAEKVDGGVKVSVGSVAHPMEEKHWIEWIELVANGQSLIQFLNPGDTPEVVFKTDATECTARSYCNLHGFWKSA